MSSQSRLLRVFTGSALSIFRDVDSTYLLGNLFPYYTSHRVKMFLQASSRSFLCSSLCMLPIAWSLCTLEKRVAPSHEKTHQRYKPSTSKGGAVLMNPNSKSQTETGSRYQKKFLHNVMTFVPQGTSTKSQVQHSVLMMASALPVLCNWAPPCAHNQLSRCCRRQLILMQQSNYFKRHNFLAMVYVL